MLREELRQLKGSYRGNRFVQWLLLLTALAINGAVVSVSAYFFYKYEVKPAIGIENAADKLEKEYVWVADWMAVPSDKIKAINRIVDINKRINEKKINNDYIKIKRKIIKQLLIILNSQGESPKLRSHSIDGIMNLVEDDKSIFHLLAEPLLYLEPQQSSFWISQIREKIFILMYRLDACNDEITDLIYPYVNYTFLNGAEKMIMSGVIGSIELKCGKNTDIHSLLSPVTWNTSLEPVYFARKGKIKLSTWVTKELNILKDSKADYKKRAESARNLAKVKTYKWYIMSEMINVLKTLLPEKIEYGTQKGYIRLNILFTLPKINLCYKPMIKTMNKIWENKFVAPLERNLATGIIGQYNIKCNKKKIDKIKDLKK